MTDRALLPAYVIRCLPSVSNNCDACMFLFCYSRMIQSFANPRKKRTRVQLLLVENDVSIVIMASDSQHGVSVADKL